MPGNRFRTVVTLAEGIKEDEQRQRLGKVARILLRAFALEAKEKPLATREKLSDDADSDGFDVQHPNTN